MQTRNSIVIALGAIVAYGMIFPEGIRFGSSDDANNGGGRTAPALPCLNNLCSVVLGPKKEVINPKGYYFYSRVDVGRVILSGPNGEKEVGPEGIAFDGTFTTNAVRANGETATMRYILCPGPKSNWDRWDCN